MNIHPTAVVSPGVSIGKDVSIGPYCVIEGDVMIEDHVHLMSHVVVKGKTSIGAHTTVYPFASLGYTPQHMGFKSDGTELIIGTHNIIREHVTIHRGTLEGGGMTRIGSRCLFMVGCHVAHDCQVGDDVIMANQVALGGHVILENHVVIGGLVGIHQFTRIGEGAMVGGYSAVSECVIPYGMIVGNRAKLQGLNVRKLKKLGVSTEEIQAISKAYQWLFYHQFKTFMYRVHHIPETLLLFPRVCQIKDFILSHAKRAICFPLERNNLMPDDHAHAFSS